jgi:cell division septation protein DedD
MKDALSLALENRPEIDQTIKKIKAACIRKNVAYQDLLPTLDLVLEASIMGLQKDYDGGEAWQDQFNPTRPGYLAGVKFEYPLGNNQAEARYRRRRLEVRQLTNQLKTTVESVLLEVQVSIRELLKTHRKMARKYQIMQILDSEIQDLETRKDLVLTDNQPYGTYLDELLDAYNRRYQGRFEFCRSLITYNLSLDNLNRSTGILLDFNEVNVHRHGTEDMPALIPVLESSTQVRTPTNKSAIEPIPTNTQTALDVLPENKASYASRQAPATSPKQSISNTTTQTTSSTISQEQSFIVWAGCYGKTANLKRTTASLKKSGFSPTVTKASDTSAPLSCLYLGPFPSRSKAEDVAEKISLDMGLETRIAGI